MDIQQIKPWMLNELETNGLAYFNNPLELSGIRLAQAAELALTPAERPTDIRFVGIAVDVCRDWVGRPK